MYWIFQDSDTNPLKKFLKLLYSNFKRLLNDVRVKVPTVWLQKRSLSFKAEHAFLLRHAMLSQERTIKINASMYVNFKIM